MDLDGHLDIAAALLENRGLVWLNSGDGTFSPARLIQANAKSPRSGPYRLPIADLDCDGLPDVIVPSKDPYVSILRNSSE